MDFRKTDTLTIEINDKQADNLSSKTKIEKMLKSPDVLGFDIYSDDKHIGFAMLKEFEKGKFFLWDYVIVFELQNKGFGTKALRELIELLKKDYGAKLLTTTYKFGNNIAKRLYEKIGFVETDIVDDGDVHEVNMKLEL